MPDTNKKKPHEEALDDVLDAFQSQWKIVFDDDGLRMAKKIFGETLGRYLADLEGPNEGTDIWAAPNLKELPAFILGNVVARIARQLRLTSGGSAVGGALLFAVAHEVMDASDTREVCRVVVDSYESKIAHPVTPTPICEAKLLPGR